VRAYGPPDPLDHEGVRSSRSQPTHDLQLDFRRESRVRANRGRIHSDLRRYAVARCGVTGTLRGVRLPGGVRTARVKGPEKPLGGAGWHSSADLQRLFHRLNNQLGVLLAQAELLEVKAADDANRVRAAQVVSSTLEALGTVREIRQRAELRAS
jgi:hypothetical protein